MRISDWSSDVSSSDLLAACRRDTHASPGVRPQRRITKACGECGRRTAAGPSYRAIRRLWVDRCVRADAECAGVRGGHADDHRPGVAQPLHDFGILRWTIIPEK